MTSPPGQARTHSLGGMTIYYLSQQGRQNGLFQRVGNGRRTSVLETVHCNAQMLTVLFSETAFLQRLLFSTSRFQNSYHDSSRKCRYDVRLEHRIYSSCVNRLPCVGSGRYLKRNFVTYSCSVSETDTVNSPCLSVSLTECNGVARQSTYVILQSDSHTSTVHDEDSQLANF